jgi:hypothetical protein
MSSSTAHPWRDAFKISFHAARENLIPCICGQLIILAFIALYFIYPPSRHLLTSLAEFRAAGGLLTSFLMTGFAGGFLAEVLRVYTLQRGQWKRKNLLDAAFMFVIIGLGGLAADRLYALQNHLFGTDLTPLIIIQKVLFDQFLYAPLIIAPYMAFVFEWRDARFSFRTLWSQRHGLYTRRVIPFLLTNWSFWIPMTIIIYSMPALLQIPILVFITAIWGSVLISLDHFTRQKLHSSAPSTAHT